MVLHQISSRFRLFSLVAVIKFLGENPGACPWDNGQGVVDVFAHRRAGPRARHLGDGTAHIAVEPDEPLVPELPGRRLHERCLAAEQLDDDRPVLRAGGEQFRRAGALVDEPLGADHLSAADRRAEPAAQQAKRQVRPSGQRGEPRLVGSERQKNVVRQTRPTGSNTSTASVGYQIKHHA